LIISALSVAGVVLASILFYRERKRLIIQGYSQEEVNALTLHHAQRPDINWFILGGGVIFALVSVALGLSEIPYAQEWVFAISMTIVVFLISPQQDLLKKYHLHRNQALI
jgi:hypothetical protein